MSLDTFEIIACISSPKGCGCSWFLFALKYSFTDEQYSLREEPIFNNFNEWIFPTPFSLVRLNCRTCWYKMLMWLLCNGRIHLIFSFLSHNFNCFVHMFYTNANSSIPSHTRSQCHPNCQLLCFYKHPLLNFSYKKEKRKKRLANYFAWSKQINLVNEAV